MVLHKMLVAPGKLVLNKTTKSEARRFTFRVVESVKHLHKEHGHEEKDQVIVLYHVPLKKRRVMSQLCVPLVEDLYDFTYKLWEKVRYFLSEVFRVIPSNTLLHAVLSFFIQGIYSET
jgi:hypothetical protein